MSDAAQRAYREAKEDAEGGPRVVKVGDPLLDLIGTTVGGLIGTVDRRVREHEVDDTATALAATPRSREQPVYRPYSFERVVVRAEKQAVVPVALLDSAGRELRRVELRQRERREFFVLHGLSNVGETAMVVHAVVQHSPSPAALCRLGQRPPSGKLHPADDLLQAEVGAELGERGQPRVHGFRVEAVPVEVERGGTRKVDQPHPGALALHGIGMPRRQL